MKSFSHLMRIIIYKNCLRLQYNECILLSEIYRYDAVLFKMHLLRKKRKKNHFNYDSEFNTKSKFLVSLDREVNK